MLKYSYIKEEGKLQWIMSNFIENLTRIENVQFDEKNSQSKEWTYFNFSLGEMDFYFATKQQASSTNFHLLVHDTKIKGNTFCTFCNKEVTHLSYCSERDKYLLIQLYEHLCAHSNVRIKLLFNNKAR